MGDKSSSQALKDIIARLKLAGDANLKGDLDWTSEEVGRCFIELAQELNPFVKILETTNK